MSIAAVVDQVGVVELPDPVALAPRLADALTEVVDPRKRRGVRHELVVVLTAAVCAVAAGARSFVAVAEWVADLSVDAAAALRVDHRCPSESTIRRILGQVDADRFDAVIGAFVQRLCAMTEPVGRRRVLAVAPAEVDRRLERQRLPDLVDVTMFCKILGEEGSLLSKARLYQLREQQPDDFPRAVAPGVWLRSMAEHYSDTRNRLAGRPPRTPAPEGHHPACATCGHAVLKHGT